MEKELMDDIEQAKKLGEKLTGDQIPQILVEAMAGKPLHVAGVPDGLISNQSPTERGSETKGLVLSKDNIIKIKEYVKYGEGLPLDIPAIQLYLGYNNFYDRTQYEGLKPENFRRLHVNINSHCKEWHGLEAAIKNTGTSLNIFGQNFVITGTDIVGAIDEMPITKKIKSLKSVNRDLVFEADDKAIKLTLLELIDGLKKQVENRQRETKELLARIEAYRSYMECEIIPMSARMSTLLSKIDLETEQEQLLKDIQWLESEIKTLGDQYDKMVGLAFTGAAGLIAGPVGIISWAVTGGVYGDKAEKIRKKRNKYKSDLETKRGVFAANDKMKLFVSGVNDRMLEMKIILNDAVTGIKNLEVLWDSVSQYIDDSYSQLKEVDDAMSLLVFKNRMTSAVASWEEVRDITWELVALFNKAEEIVNKAGEKEKKENSEDSYKAPAANDSEKNN